MGKRADLVLLTSNPLADISNTRQIAGVMVRGRWLEQQELTQRLHDVPQQYRQEQQKVQAMLRSDPVQAVGYLAEHDPLERLAAEAISEVAAGESTSELMQMLQQIRKANPKAELVSEDSINNLGYGLMGKKLYQQSIAVLAMNTEQFPR
jgi:hypothetical protein